MGCWWSMECCGSGTLELEIVRITHYLYFIKLKSNREVKTNIRLHLKKNYPNFLFIKITEF